MGLDRTTVLLFFFFDVLFEDFFVDFFVDFFAVAFFLLFTTLVVFGRERRLLLFLVRWASASPTIIMAIQMTNKYMSFFILF
jgi:hypothetical protein